MKVMAGTRLFMALPIDVEAKYKPSKYKFWLIVTLQKIKIISHYQASLSI